MDKKFYILGVKINAIRLKDVVDFIDETKKNKTKDYIVLTGSHGIVEMQKDEQLKEINNQAGLVTPDGFPQALIGKIMGYKNIEKIAGSNIMPYIFKYGLDKEYRHFLYGGSSPEVLKKLIAKIKLDFPGIIIAGSFSPPFRPLTSSEKRYVIDKINKSKADIVWCGLGCPKQEKWMAEFRSQLNSSILIGVGAGFDFLSGTKPLAPRWIFNSGFEWLFRLINDPKRLWKRYANVIPVFIFYVLLESLKLKKFKK